MCMCTPGCASLPHLCLPSPKGLEPVAMEMGHRCFSGSPDTCDVIMEQEEEMVPA